MKSATLASIFRSIRAYNGAPEMAKAAFSDVMHDPELIQLRFKELYKAQNHPFAECAIGCASNYALIKSFIQNNDEIYARDMVKTLAEKDDPICLMDFYLEMFNESLEELVMSKGEFVVPNQINEYLFKKYATESIEQKDNYVEKDGVLVASKMAENTYFCSGMSKQVIQKIGLHPEVPIGYLLQMSNIASTRFGWKDTKEALEKKAPEIMEQRGVENYSLIFANHEGMNTYVPISFLFAAVASDYGDSIIDLDYRHSIISINNEK